MNSRIHAKVNKFLCPSFRLTICDATRLVWELGFVSDVIIEGQAHRVRYIGMDTLENAAPFSAEPTATTAPW